jgi:hypothetical protein
LADKDSRAHKPDSTEKALLDIIEKYNPRIEKEIERFLAIVLSEDKYVTERDINNFQKRVDSLLSEAAEKIREWENVQFREYYDTYVKAADDEIREARIKLDETLISGAKTLHDRSFRNLKLEFERHISDSFGIVARQANDIFRQVQIASAIDGFTGTDNINKVIKGIRQRLDERGITGFIDKRGRAWTLRNYSEMSARTVTAQARIRAKEMEFLAHGQDLVIVSVHFPTCPLCLPWSGRILSLTGQTEGYPTIETARGEGLFHPNCLHNVSLVTQDMIELFGIEELTH